MVESFCIDSCLMGTERNLLVDNGYRWIDNIPENVWHLSGKIKLNSDRCIDTLMRLSGHHPDLHPPLRFVNAMRCLVSQKNVEIPWSYVMPEKDHRAFVRKLINEAAVSIDTLSKDYYMNTWVPQSTILRSLQPACVNLTRYNELMSSTGSNNHTINEFKPGDDGFASVVDYDRFATRTGRLTVISGPKILTLNRNYRDLLIPSVKGGKIAYIDFAALEARILLYEAGGRCEDVDLYTFISKELFGGSVSRDVIKQAVISELYGSSIESLGETLGIAGKDLYDFVNKVKYFFKTKDLLKRVKDEFIKTGKISNRYGRQLVIDEPLDRIFVNTYAQSTGVDVSLLGFSEILNRLKHVSGIRPLFVLHDALLLDVSPDALETISNIDKVNIHGYVNAFPLKCEFISSCTK